MVLSSFDFINCLDTWTEITLCDDSWQIKNSAVEPGAKILFQQRKLVCKVRILIKVEPSLYSWYAEVPKSTLKSKEV